MKHKFLKHKQQQKYEHYLVQDCNGKKRVLLGFSSELSNEDIEKLINLQQGKSQIKFLGCKIYPSKIFELDIHERNIFISAFEKYENEIKKENKIQGLYFDIIIDFIFAYWENNINQITEDFLFLSDKVSNDVYEKHKQIYEAIQNLRKSKSGTKHYLGIEITKYICYKYAITESVLTTGTGEMYLFDSNKYSLKNIKEYVKKNKEQEISIKQMILDITGISEKDIEVVSVNIVTENSIIDTKIYDFINILIDEMKNRR